MLTNLALTLIGIAVILNGVCIINIFKRLKRLETPNHRLWRK